MLHEIGHTFNLDDASGISVMGNVPNVSNTITPCDNTKVATMYCPLTPEPGGCQGQPDWAQFPQTGCVFGYTNNGSTCGRSTYFVNYCNQYGGGYDSQTCDCPDSSGACMAPAQGCYNDYFWLDQTCECASYSPTVVDVVGNGFNLTSAIDGVNFDIAPNGVTERLAWTAANSDDAWLVLDRNGNGVIDSGSELFGNYTPQPQTEEKNGFLALTEFDKAEFGGNNDGSINSSDAIFANLRLWQDVNHNGISEESELHTLASKSVAEMELDYRSSGRVDEHGNRFRYRAKVRNAQGGDNGRWAWDVFLVAQQPMSNNIVAFFRPSKTRCRS